MLDLAWSRDIAEDPLALADAIELLVAFSEEDCNGKFSRAHFLRFVIGESLDPSESTPISGEYVDELNAQFEQSLNLIKDRSTWLGSAYPFVVDSEEITLSPPEGIDQCLPYLFLLVCSNGRFVPSLKSSLPDHFENLCKEAFKALFPDWADVVSFSQKSDDRKTIFGYAAKDAVPKLAEKLNTTSMNVDQLSHTPREFGIDLIAICEFGDQAPYPAFAFAQCTLRQDWWTKRHEAIAGTELSGFISLNAKHSNYLMIPHFPRYQLQVWSEDPGRTGNCIICDRLRLCKLLEKSSSFIFDSPPASIAGIFNSIRVNLVPVQG